MLLFYNFPMVVKNNFFSKDTWASFTFDTMVFVSCKMCGRYHCNSFFYWLTLKHHLCNVKFMLSNIKINSQFNCYNLL